MTTIDATLAERGARYGDFTDHACIAQGLQDIMRAAGDTTGWQALNATQKQALTVIADKIARILTGDPNYADNWHDIQGYAKLVEDRLPSAEPPKADEWIEWKGGERPVPSGTQVEVCLSDSRRSKGKGKADVYTWDHGRKGRLDIVAYRVVKD